jgi:hypothetical protein
VRKVIAIGLIALLLFNVAGYYGLFIGLQYSNDQKNERFADLDLYLEHELTTIKIPLTIPYASNSENFERADRKIEFKGEHYRLVKHKLNQDTLYLLCSKDRDSKQISEAFTDFVKTVSDQPTKHNGNALPSFLKEYLCSGFEINTLNIGWSLQLLPKHFQTSTSVNYTETVIQPPEA